MKLAGDVVGESAQGLAEGLGDGEIMMCENVRFEPGEESKEEAERQQLAQAYAALAGAEGAFVSDGFGVVHRKQASVYDVAKLLPNAAGDLVENEVEVLKRLTDDPQQPYVVVLGGAKVSDKLKVIDNLLAKADALVIGGGMVFTFLKAQGHEVGKSLLEEDQADQLGLDIGPESALAFANVIRSARTVFWNGPMGVFEMDAFAGGTREVAEALTHVHGLSVVGGGDSASAVRHLGFSDDQFGHISTGGGASLEYLEGKELPGLAVLEGGDR